MSDVGVDLPPIVGGQTPLVLCLPAAVDSCSNWSTIKSRAGRGFGARWSRESDATS